MERAKIRRINTHPGPSSQEHEAAAEPRRQRRKQEGEGPHTADSGDEEAVADGAREGDLVAGVEGDGEDEEAARDVSELNQPALREADARRSLDSPVRCPVERDHEPERLEQVRQDQLVN